MLSGGCICGKCRYQVDQEPGFGLLCQCSDCQKTTGTGHAALMVVKRSAFSIDGPTKTHERVLENKNTVAHVFCSECGNPLVNQTSGYPDICFIHAGSLDDPAIFEPKKGVHRLSGHDWDLKDPEIN